MQKQSNCITPELYQQHKQDVRIWRLLLETLQKNPSCETVTLTEFKTGERGHMAIIIQETNTEGEGDPYYEVKKSHVGSELIFNR